MKKKIYDTPATVVVHLKIGRLLQSQSMDIDNSHTVTNSGDVYSREDSDWDDDEEF